MNSLTLTIDGRFIAKKNSRRSLKNRRTGKMFSAPSEAFEAYKISAIKQIRKQVRSLEEVMLAGFSLNKKTNFMVTPPYRVDYLFEVKGKGRIDVYNAMASINDILQDVGVIDDDANITEGFFKKDLGEEEWKAIVIITSLS